MSATAYDTLVIPTPAGPRLRGPLESVAQDPGFAVEHFWARLSPLLGAPVKRRTLTLDAPTSKWTDVTAQRTLERGTVKIGFVAASRRWRVKATLDGARVYFASDILGAELNGHYYQAARALMRMQHPEGF